MSVSRTDTMLLLAHMLKTPEILETACKQLLGKYFTDPAIGGTVFSAFVFEVIRTHYTKYQIAPDFAVITRDLMTMIQEFRINQDQAALAEMISLYGELVSLVPSVDIGSVPVARGVVEDITRICVHDVLVQAEIDKAKAIGSLTDLGASVVRVNDNHRQLLGTSARRNLYTGEDEPEVKRVLFGIDFLDKKLGDGLGPPTGCAGVIIVPQGGGKTSIAFQFCVSQILLGKPALLVITEGGWDLVINAKVYACLTGIPYNIILRHRCNMKRVVVDPECIGPDFDPTTIDIKLEAFNRYFYVHDMIAKPGNMDSIKLEVDRITREHNGVPPGVVAVDWAGPLADYMMANTGERECATKEAAIRKIAERCAKIGSECGTFCWLTHQMNNEQIQRGPAADATEYCGLDCKNIGQAMKLVLTINKKCPKTGIQKMCIPKARDSVSAIQILVRLNGALSRFSEATEYRQAGRRFTKEQAWHGTEVPVERAKRNSAATE